MIGFAFTFAINCSFVSATFKIIKVRAVYHNKKEYISSDWPMEFAQFGIEFAVQVEVDTFDDSFILKICLDVDTNSDYLYPSLCAFKIHNACGFETLVYIYIARKCMAMPTIIEATTTTTGSYEALQRRSERLKG